METTPYTEDYIQGKFDAMIELYNSTNDPSKPVYMYWTDPSVPSESRKMYHKFIEKESRGKGLTWMGKYLDSLATLLLEKSEKK